MRDAGVDRDSDVVPEEVARSEGRFPGDRMAEFLGVAEKVRKVMGIIARIKHAEHGKAPKSPYEFYHSEEEHIDVLLEAAVSAGEAMKYIKPEGEEMLVAGARGFVDLMSAGDISKIVERQKFGGVLTENSFGKEENGKYTDEDSVLLYAALAFHDIGRFQGIKEGDGGTRWTKRHEVRSIERLKEIFGPDSIYPELKDQLVDAYPELFGPDKLDKTLAKISYMIYWTKYVRSQEEEDKTYEELGLDPAERQKMDTLGALTMTMDIGIMQVKSSAFHSMAGLVNEYLSDKEIKGDELIFTSVENWILRWTTDMTLPLSMNVMQLIKSMAYVPTFLSGGGRYIDPEDRLGIESLIVEEENLRETDPRKHIAASAASRRKLLEYIKSQGVDVTKSTTWNRLKELVDGFVRQKGRLP